MATTPTDWTSLLSGGLKLAGSVYGANQAVNAANTAAQMSQFRPVGITTRFGKSGFNYDPATGQLVGAGYQVAPDVAAMREGLLGLAGSGLSQAQQAQAFQPQVNQAGQGLFNLGQQYLAQTPQQAAQDWMAKQQQLLAPGREQALAQATNKEFQRGTMGLATGATEQGYAAGAPGLMASNPRMAALYNAQAAQDAQLAAQAQQAGMDQTRFGQGLLTGGMDVMRGGYGVQTAALQPYTNYMQGSTNIEDAALNALKTGASLGSSSAAAAENAARQYMAGQEAQQSVLRGVTTQIGNLADPIVQLIRGLSSGSTALSPAAQAGYNQAVNYAATSPTGWLDF